MVGAVGDRWIRATNDKSMTKLRGFHDLARECISKAIEADERGSLSEALPYYRTALEIIRDGLSVKIISRQNAEVEKQQQEMMRWRSSVQERLAALSKKGLSGSPRSTQTPPLSRSPSGVFSFKDNSSESNEGDSNRRTTPKLSKPRIPSTGREENRKDKKAESVKGVDSKIVQMIEDDIVDRSPGVKWDDIAGLERAKQALKEMVILPTLRSDLFQGLRKPARGLLLYGPPGNGKTMLAKAVASEASATFFSLSASSLTSKWVGEGEKLMKALFAVAAERQPSVIFIDEIDSILSSRSSNEHEASRRLKTEFLVQFDGVMANDNDRVIVMGATNRPQELDDAARRRLVKRIYIPLPDFKARRALLKHVLKGQAFQLSDDDLETIVSQTEGYSGSDLKALCQEAALMPIRELGSRISTVKANQVRKGTLRDFEGAKKTIRASVSKEQLDSFQEWHQTFGST